MKIKILSIITIILIFIAGITGFFVYQKVEENKKIEKEIQKISKVETTFSSTNEHSEKLDILKSTLNNMNDYRNSKKKFAEVTDAYNSTVASMRKTITEEYDSIIIQNTLDELDSVEDIDIITVSKNNLSSLLSTIETEKDYTFSTNEEFEKYKQKINTLTDSYANRITDIEEAKRKAEEELAKTHYENEYFSVDVPKEWIGYWSVTEEDNSLPDIFSRIYHFSYNNTDTPEEDNGGASVYILDMSNKNVSLAMYRTMIPQVPDTGIGSTSNGMEVFVIEAGGGFFWDDGGAKITLK